MAFIEPERLSERARSVMEREACVFSVISLWETAIKTALGRSDFRVAPGDVRDNAIAGDLVELPVFAEHALEISKLPFIHRDPFDRMLLAQARVEGLTLLTADKTLTRYPAPVMVAGD